MAFPGELIPAAVLLELFCLFTRLLRLLKRKIKLSNSDGFFTGPLMDLLALRRSLQIKFSPVIFPFGFFKRKSTDCYLLLARLVSILLLYLNELPSANGARQLYMSHLRPFLLRHQARLDHIVEFLYGEMNKFVSAHQAEFQFVKALLTKILASVNQIARDVIRPGERQANGAFQGPARLLQDQQSDNED